MAFTDWVFEKSSSDVITFTDIFLPIDNTGSLQVNHLSGLDLFMNTYNDTYVRGIIKGRIQTLIQPTALVGASTYLGGILCMQDQDDMTGSTSTGTGSCYGCFYAATSGGTTTFFTLVKFTLGLDTFGGSGTVIYTGPNLGTFVPGTTTAMELEWDASSGTQVDFIIRRALSDTDFGNMVVESTPIDNTAALVTSVGEGLATVNDAASTSGWKIDNTTIFTTL